MKSGFSRIELRRATTTCRLCAGRQRLVTGREGEIDATDLGDAVVDPRPQPRCGSAPADRRGKLATAVPVLAMMVAAAVIYMVRWGSAVQMGSDTAEYQGIARDLSDGSLAQINDRTPGYPAVLLATGSSTTLSPALLAVQWAFHLGACWMALLLARRVGPPRWAPLAFAAALLSSLNLRAVWSRVEPVRWMRRSEVVHRVAGGDAPSAAHRPLELPRSPTTPQRGDAWLVSVGQRRVGGYWATLRLADLDA